MKITQRKRLTKGLLLILLLPCFMLSVFSARAGGPGDWTLVSENGSIKAYAQVGSCGEDEAPVYLIKFENTDANSGYSLEYTLNVSNDPTTAPASKTIELSKSSVLVGECKNQSLMAYAFQSEEINLSMLELNILTIKTLTNEN